MNTSNESTNLWSLATDMDDDGNHLAKAAETGVSAWVKQAVESCLGQTNPLDLEALLQSTKKNSEAPEEEKMWFGGDINRKEQNGVFTRFFPLPNKSGFSDSPAVSRIFRPNRRIKPSSPIEDVGQVEEIHYSHEAQRQVTISYDLDGEGHFRFFSVTTPTYESLGIAVPYASSMWTTVYTNCKGRQINDLEQFPKVIRQTIQTFIDRENKTQGFGGDDR